MTALTLAALGVVYGDIGTSPIYTLKECFSPHSPHHIDPTHAHILGVVSLVLWSLLLLVCVKYLIFILRADNKGEGGVLSLMALASHGMSETLKRRVVIVLLGLFGAALLFGDGIITPAISVLSAVEGLKDGGVLGAAPTEAQPPAPPPPAPPRSVPLPVPPPPARPPLPRTLRLARPRAPRRRRRP
jgi:K+ transporter